MANLIEGIQAECERVRKILPHYTEIGPVGAFGAAMLKQCIHEGEAAIASGEVTRMVLALTALQDCSC